MCDPERFWVLGGRAADANLPGSYFKNSTMWCESPLFQQVMITGGADFLVGR